jgi:hypothetical protein
MPDVTALVVLKWANSERKGKQQMFSSVIAEGTEMKQFLSQISSTVG